MKFKRIGKNVGNITSTLGNYPRNGYKGDTKQALYMVYYLKCERQCHMFKVACVVKIKLFFYGLVLL